MPLRTWVRSMPFGVTREVIGEAASALAGAEGPADFAAGFEAGAAVSVELLASGAREAGAILLTES